MHDEVGKTMSSSTKADKRPIDVQCFKALKVLGKGSFGDVYLVERALAEGENPATCLTVGQQFAMKILPKAKIFKHNLIRYAVTERKVMTIINHPFIIKLKFSF